MTCSTIFGVFVFLRKPVIYVASGWRVTSSKTINVFILLTKLVIYMARRIIITTCFCY